MHNELVSFVQSNHAADGVEVRAVGPKAVTLALPPELHDVGNLCGELECRFNARIDIHAAETPGVGPTATVWVMQDAVANNLSDSDNDVGNNDNDGRERTDAGPQSPKPPAPPEDRKDSRRGWDCTSPATLAAALGMLAAAATIASHSTTLWKHWEL